MINIFSNGRITLKALTIDDVASLFDAVRESITSLSYWLPSGFPLDYSIDDARQSIASAKKGWGDGTEFRFGIFDCTTNEFLGIAGINNINRRYNFGNVGYWIRDSQRNQGIATEATRLAIAAGISEFKFSRLEIFVLLANEPSRRVAEKIGAIREGIARNRLIFKGFPTDAIAYSIVPGDIVTSHSTWACATTPRVAADSDSAVS